MKRKTSDFDEYYRLFSQKLYGLAFKMVRNRQDAMDIVQEGFVKAYRNWDKFRGDAAVSTWLYKITLNLSYDFLKKQSRVGILPVKGDFEDFSACIGEKKIMESDKLELIKTEMDRLTPRQKSVFILKSYDELSYKEIAKITNSRIGTVKATYFQTVQKIRKGVAEKWIAKNSKK